MNQEVARLVILSGLTPLIPVPYLDGVVERKFLRQAVEKLAIYHTIQLEDQALEQLVEDRGSILLGCLTAVLWWPIKKLFRTIFFFLAVKDVIDLVSVNAHRIAMIDLAIREGRLPGDAAGVRQMMDQTLGQVRVSPVSRMVLRLEKGEQPGWPQDPDPAMKAVSWAHKQGGGAVVLDKFRTGLQVKA